MMMTALMAIEPTAVVRGSGVTSTTSAVGAFVSPPGAIVKSLMTKLASPPPRACCRAC